MEIRQLSTKSDVTAFHRLPFELYKNDPNWIPHIRQDIEAVFNPEINPFFIKGDAIRWLAINNGKTIGRMAAFVNESTAHSFSQPTGGIGFFESVNDQEVANKLFDCGKEWLQGKGMEAMDGPVNFGENDRYWGLITEHFDRSPYYCQNYNPEYYVRLFENYGFRCYFKQLIFGVDTTKTLPKAYLERAARIARNGQITFASPDIDNLDKFMADFMHVYNNAWAEQEGFKPIDSEQAKTIVRKMKPIVDPRIAIFAYHNREPVGFFINLPEINEIMRYVNGNLNVPGKLKFLWYKWRKVCKTTFGVAFGVDPRFQKRGLEGALFHQFEQNIRKTQYRNVLISWIGDFNPKMIRIIQVLGAEKVQEMTTYRYLFDPNAPFERKPIIH